MDFFKNFVKTHTEKKIVIKGHPRKYLVGGKGKKGFVVFPGAGQDAYSCYDLIDYYEKKYKVIAFNYEGIKSLKDFFEYVNRVLKKEKVQTIYLYGISLGGFLAQHYLRRYPKKVKLLVLSHTGTVRSKTISKKIIRPAKIIRPLIGILPFGANRKIFSRLIGFVQSGKTQTQELYRIYSTKQNWERRFSYFKSDKMFDLLNKEYLQSVFKLGFDILDKEKDFKTDDLKDWNGKILIIKTDNDPLAKDDGIFKEYYPKAKVVTFTKTGHLTPFIQFEKMVKSIDQFLV